MLGRLDVRESRARSVMAERVQVTLDVQGMTCDGCAAHEERALRGSAGVEDPKVPSWRAGRATLTADADMTARCNGGARPPLSGVGR